jgi:sterol desaturase/sphingolipid hydroxylase (fatty acid hydroxylase superfamily)
VFVLGFWLGYLCILRGISCFPCVSRGTLRFFVIYNITYQKKKKKRANLSNHGSLLSHERIGEHAAFVTTCVSSSSIVVAVAAVVVLVFMAAMVLEAVVELVVDSLTNVLIVVVVIILWIFVGIYTTNRLVLPIRLFLWRILLLFLDPLLV